MIANHWIENSRKAYSALLNLYPKEHRSDYGVSMQQVFTDQCRSAWQQKGAAGIILLWLRTLPDLGRSALLEHVTSPRAAWGLMEPVPDAPLPWKGIFLILLPGLVYLVSQIAQLTGQPWYLTVYYRAAFLLILPVLAVWAVTRRFPIWGLIPVGLLYRLVIEIGYRFITLYQGAFSHNSALNAVLTIVKMARNEFWIPVSIFSIAIALLAWRYMRQQKPSRGFWVWLGIYLVVAVLRMADSVERIIQFSRENAASIMPFPGTLQSFLHDGIGQDLYSFTALLLLVFIGTIFTRKHGFFTILILIGYMIPTIVFAGAYDFESAANPTTALILVSIGVLVYRSLLSLIAPIWVSRTRSQDGKKSVVLISVAFALGIHILMQLALYLGLLDSSSYAATAEFGEIFRVVVLRYVFLPELTLISAVILGIVMYQSNRSTDAAPVQSVGEVPQTVAE